VGSNPTPSASARTASVIMDVFEGFGG